MSDMVGLARYCCDIQSRLLSSTLSSDMSTATPRSVPTSELEDWDRSMGVVVVPMTPPRFNASLPGELGSPRRSLAEVMKLHGASDIADMSDEEEEYLSEALGDWVCKILILIFRKIERPA